MRKSRPFMLIVAVLLVAVVSLSAVLVVRRLVRPEGINSAEEVIAGYLAALQARDADQMEGLVWEEWNATSEVRRHIRLWGGTDPTSIKVDINRETVSYIRMVKLTSDQAPYLNVELSIVRQSGDWYLAMGEAAK